MDFAFGRSGKMFGEQLVCGFHIRIVILAYQAITYNGLGGGRIDRDLTSVSYDGRPLQFELPSFVRNECVDLM